MKIELNNPGFAAALLQRMKAEFAETAFANFALDLAGDTLLSENEALKTRVADLEAKSATLVERTTKDKKLIDGLRAELDAARGRRRAVKG